MAKKSRIPKKIAGVKVPKPLRKSKMLRAMLGNVPTGTTGQSGTFLRQ
ncbi:hypothetical protein [Sinorhizobium fredii]|nr:hypothetical protein [Sinorhizobium fredii]WOS64678.1 hypothetical protein SFGR64A_00660 [Sinorhizobium fredii GR64]